MNKIKSYFFFVCLSGNLYEKEDVKAAKRIATEENNSFRFES